MILGAEAAYAALEDDTATILTPMKAPMTMTNTTSIWTKSNMIPMCCFLFCRALHEGQWTIGEVQGTLQMLFDRQYILTEDVVVETRYQKATMDPFDSTSVRHVGKF